MQSGVEARLVDHPDGNGQERYVLCRSSARGAKECAMIKRQMSRLTEEMLKIARSLQRKAQSDLNKIGRRIGRFQGKYPAASRLLEIVLIKDGGGRAGRMANRDSAWFLRGLAAGGRRKADLGQR